LDFGEKNEVQDWKKGFLGHYLVDFRYLPFGLLEPPIDD
jgi:hypothetical protein